MENITAYRTLDGKIFDSKKEAEYHETWFEFEEWYDKNPLYGNIQGSRVDLEELVEWFENNKKEVLNFIKKINEG